MRSLSLALAVSCACCLGGDVGADELPIISLAGVESQPIRDRVRQLPSVLERLGQPLDGQQLRQLDEALAELDQVQAVMAIQHVLDPLCLVGININPESRVKVARGPAAALLYEQGWRVFLIKVHNEAGVTAPLRVTSPNAAPLDVTSTKSRPEPKATAVASAHWLAVSTYDQQPMLPQLSGLPLDYRILRLYSRELGQREATLAFDVGQGTQDLGFRSEVPILFKCQRAARVIKPAVGQGDRGAAARRYDGFQQNDGPFAAAFHRDGGADRPIRREAYNDARSSRRDGN
jgi:hypothetical protein